MEEMKTTEVGGRGLPQEPLSGLSPSTGQVNASWGMLGFKKRLLILGAGQLGVDLCRIIVSQNRWLVDIVGFLAEKAGGRAYVEHKLDEFLDPKHSLEQLRATR